MPVWDLIMRISDVELKKVMETSGYSLVENEHGFESSPRPDDYEMIKDITAQVIAMPDREAMISELKERIEKGEYRPSGEDIADTMIRRSIADRIR